MWKVIWNHIGFVVPPSVIVRQTYVFQLEEKARNQSRNGYPRFTALTLHSVWFFSDLVPFFDRPM